VGGTRLLQRTNILRDLQFLWETLWTTITCGPSRCVAFTDVSEVRTASIFGTILRNVGKRLPDYAALHSSKWWGKAKIKFTELLGFWTFSIVWYSREHDVSETGSVSVLRWRWGGKTRTQLSPLERANLNHWNTRRWKNSKNRWLKSCVNLTEVVQWLRLALPKGPNWVGVFSHTFIWGRKQIQFPKRRVL
jgi:hypothetical protein